MKKLFLLLALFGLISPGWAQPTIHAILFEPDVSQLSQGHFKLIDETLARYALDELQSIRLAGYADTNASAAYNQRLSQRRVDAVKNYLIKRGIDPTLITATAHGESKAQSRGDLGMDRRVDLQYTTRARAATQENPGTTIGDLYGIMIREVQEFCIEPDKDTTIRGEQGTIIHIKANSFRISRKQRAGYPCVRFQLKEAFNKSEMVLNNLSTTSDGQILETMGMTYTNAMIGNDTVELLRPLTILVPTDTILPGSKIFDGARNQHAEVLNWAVANNSVLRNFSVTDLKDCSSIKSVGKCKVPEPDPEISDEELWRRFMVCQCRIMCKSLKGCKFFWCKINRFFSSVTPSISLEARERRANRRAERDMNRMTRMLARNGGSVDKSVLNNFRNRFTGPNSPLPPDEQAAIEELADNILKTDSLIRYGTVNRNFIRNCVTVQRMLKDYGVDEVDDLIHLINLPLMDEFGVSTMEELLDTLPKANMANIELAYRNKSLAYEDFKFYVFNTSRLGWKNIDVFADVPEKQMVTMVIDLQPDEQVDCKLVFKERNFVLPAKVQEKAFYFDGVPKGETAWVVGIKYAEGIPYLALKEVTVAKTVVNLQFRERTLQQLKEDLKVLDGE